MPSPFDMVYQILKFGYYELQEQIDQLPEDSNERINLRRMQLSTSDHPVEMTSVNSPADSDTGECTVADCQSGQPPAISARFRNPTYSNDYTHHMCYQCADNYDLGHLVHDSQKPDVSDEPDIKLTKGDLRTNVSDEDWTTALQPLMQGIFDKDDIFQHVNPAPYEPPNDRTHLYDRLNERMPINQETGHMELNPPTNFIAPWAAANHDVYNDMNKQAQFLNMAHTKLEHIMRTKPELLEDIKHDDALSLQVGIDKRGWDRLPDSYDFARHNSHRLTKKPVDMHVVYRRAEDGRFQPMTLQPTIHWNPKGRNTKFLSAQTKNYQKLNSRDETELHDSMQKLNAKQGFDGDTYVPDDMYAQTSAVTKVEEEKEEREKEIFTGNFSPELEAYFKMNKNNEPSLRYKFPGHTKQGIRQGWWTHGNNRGMSDIIRMVQDEHDTDNISTEDKTALLKIIIRQALDSNIPRNDISPTHYQAKQFLPSIEGDEEYLHALNSIEKGIGMDLTFRLLKSDIMNLKDMIDKERKTPEAMRHKREYDTEYESSPERIKYRESLNRERQRRGMYGDHSHRDISHTEGDKLTVESEHENRQRHFKDKGTLRPLTKAVREDLELLRNLMGGPMDEQDKKIAQALMTSLEEREGEEKSEEEEELQHPFFGGSPMQVR